MKQKRLYRGLSLVLCLCLMWLLVACGGETVSSSDVASDSSPAVETEKTAEETVPSEAGIQETEMVASLSEESETAVVSYPVFEEKTTITAYLNMPSWASSYIGEGKAIENSTAILLAEEATNVHLEMNISDPDTYNEQLNLMLASSDYADIIRDASNLFSSGADGLIEEGICVDLVPYFEEYAPDYYALLESNATFKNDVTSSSGTAVAMYSYTEMPQYSRGPVVRKDMLDAVNMEIPTTVQELYDVAVALKNNGVAYPVVGPQFLAGAYDAATISSSMGSVEMTWLNVDGTIQPAIALDSMYDYIETCYTFAQEGLFVEDWYNPAPMYDSYMLNDELAMCFGPYSITSDATIATAANPETCVIYPMANVTVEKGDAIRSLDATIGGKGDGDWCITTAHPEYLTQIISYVNWFFTEEGSIASNYGIENEAFVYDENGEIQYTELILEDTSGYGSMGVFAVYTNFNDNPFYYQYERTSLTYDNEIEATVYDTWLSNITGEYVVNVKLTTEETTQYNALATDVTTTIAENASKFIMGDLPLEDWDSFIDSLYDMGLSEMTEIYQAAYDRSIDGGV